MARARAQPSASLVGLMSDQLDEDTMSDEIGREAPDSNQENFGPRASSTQKSKPVMTNGRVRQAVTKKGNAAKSRSTATRKPSKREVIIEEEDEDVEDVHELEDVEATPKPAKARGRPAKAESISRHIPAPTIEEPEFQQSLGQSPQKAPRVNGTSRTQPQPFYQLQSDGFDAGSEADIVPEDLLQPSIFQTAPQLRASSTSQQLVPSVLNRHKRAGSTSSNEGKNPDPVLRRKLGETTKKLEALEIRYRKLQDVGITEAKTNFDKLKISSDEKARISTELIKSLKTELASQKRALQQIQSLQDETESQKSILSETKAQLTATKQEINDLKSERTELKSELASAKAEIKSHATALKQLSEAKARTTALTKQLQESQTEQSNLQARLAAARSASTDRHLLPAAAAAAASQGGGNTAPGQRVPVMKVMATTSEAQAAIQQAQSISDLYSDLTGLLINHVDRRPHEKQDIFNCIQTGRNGTLHFKLSVSTDPRESYDEAEFQYLPQLDAARDQGLLQLLPYYLVEDIQFSRQEAAKFYSRVSEMLTRKFEDLDGGGGAGVEGEGEDGDGDGGLEEEE